MTAGWNRTPMEMESLTLRCMGRSGNIIRQFIQAAMNAAFEEETEEISIFVQGESWMGGWEKALSKKPRSLESVVLDENISEDLLRDATLFLSSAKWYEDTGIPYRRGPLHKYR